MIGAALFAAPSTMIILDPDLEPDHSAKMNSPKRSAALAMTGKAPIKKATEIDLPTARTFSRYLKAAQETVGLKGQVTVLLTTDETIRGLNRQFRGKNKATDVLSFPAMEQQVGRSAGERVCGDLAISVTTALRQANEQGHALWTEIKVLILHGLLHLAGFDHEVDDGKMARRELKLRAKLKLPQGLIERAGRGAASQRVSRSAGQRGSKSASQQGSKAASGQSSKSADGHKQVRTLRRQP